MCIFVTGCLAVQLSLVTGAYVVVSKFSLLHPICNCLILLSKTELEVHMVVIKGCNQDRIAYWNLMTSSPLTTDFFLVKRNS